MFGLIKKDIGFPLLAVFGIMALIWLYGLAAWSIIQDYMVSAMVLVNASFMIVGSLSMIIVEQNEFKNNTYSLIRILPLTAGEIVSSKVIMVCIVAVIYYVFASLLLTATHLAEQTRALLFLHLKLCVASGFLFALLGYWFLLKNGFGKFFRIGLQIIATVVLYVQLMGWFIFRDKFTVSVQQFFLSWTTSNANTVLLILFAVLFVTMWLFLIKSFEKNSSILID